MAGIAGRDEGNEDCEDDVFQVEQPAKWRPLVERYQIIVLPLCR